jgi:hypothetical protein
MDAKEIAASFFSKILASDLGGQVLKKRPKFEVQDPKSFSIDSVSTSSQLQSLAKAIAS